MAGPEITIRPLGGVYAVRAQGAVLGETRRALELTEGEYEPVIYVPREDLQMVFFDASDKKTTCPWKGEASYFHLVGKNRQQDNVAWSYETPLKDVERIAGHLAFYAQHLECSVDGEAVQSNEGTFYGGWITSRVVGPFKGGPGSAFW